MAVNPRIKFTVRDYMATPEDTRYELIEGELLVTPSPTPAHQRIVGKLFVLLNDFVRNKGLGEVFIAPLDVVLSEYDVLQPDILFVSKERAGIVTDRVRGAPDLVVEVLSPGTEERDRTLKRTVYARYGVREYWLVDSQRETIELLTLGPEGFNLVAAYNRDETLRSPLLAGLTLSMQQLFSAG